MSLEEREFIRRAGESCAVTFTVHAPLVFNPLKDPHADRLESTVEFAQDIGANLLNLHLDLSCGAEAFGRALRPTLKAAQKAGLVLALENSVWTKPEDFNAFFAWLQQEEPRLAKHAGMCFDLGHANVCSATQNDYCGFLDRLDENIPIVHLHLHENFGDRDSHLPLFTGPSRIGVDGILGILKRLKKRSFDGCAILEQWPQPPSLLIEARDQLEILLRAIE